MAKDPAFPFYTQDFLVGTMFFTDTEVGVYVRLLCVQHQHGGLIDKATFEIKTKDCPKVQSKFIETEDGYFNERLMMEMEKRAIKSNNLSANAKKRWSIVKQKQYKSIANVMPSEIEIENEIESIKGESVERGDHLTSNSKPTLTEVTTYFMGQGYPATEAENFWSYYDSLGWETSRGGLIKNWQSKVMGWMNNSKQFNNNGNGKEAKPINTAFNEKKNKELKQTLASFDEQIKREGKFKSFKDYEGVANVSD